MRKHTNQDGITLLITLLLMGVLLGVSSSLLNITIKQFQLSGIALASETAFQAANAGMECALYFDLQSGGGPFTVNDNGTGRSPIGSAGSPTPLTCMGVTSVDLVAGNDAVGTIANMVESGEEQRFRFSWGTGPVVCSEVSVYKFSENPANDGNTNGPTVAVGGQLMRATPCPEGSICTVVQSRGYNIACNQILNGSRVVEREYTQIY